VSRLEVPVRDHLDEPLDERAVHRIWRRIDERRRPRSLQDRPWAMALAGALAALVVAWLGGLGESAREAPLTWAGGAPIESIEGAADGQPPRRVELSDGSSLELGPGALLRALETSNRAFVAMLESGRVEIEVEPHGPRRWVIECGEATVEVVGTRFAIDRNGDAVTVEVFEGVVLVRSARIAERARRLEAGESISIGGLDAARASPGTEGEAAQGDEQAAPSDPSDGEHDSARAPPASDWRALAQAGAYDEAYRALGQGGIAAETAASSVDDLLALADVARLSGHPLEAVRPLEQIVSDHPGDGRAALAAFTLGRMQLDNLGRPSAAASSFARALALGLPGGLADDASARRVEALARAGDREGARRAAEAYRAQFPNGHHRAAIEGWLSAP
jgi:transmembrane sensor